jgi:protein-L-isoaspartate(D-aspartate) O-methyltransferase
MDAARLALIDSQVRPNDVTDRRLIAAMSALPREVFLPEVRKALAYADAVVETSPGRFLWAARDFSKLVNAAAVAPGDRILDIAPGSGYSSAVLARLGASVLALEETQEAASALKTSLSDAGVTGVEVTAGDLRAGAPGKGPFDVIFVNGAVDAPSPAWIEALAEGGRLAVVVNDGPVRRARIYTRSGPVASFHSPFETAAPALPGFEAPVRFQF